MITKELLKLPVADLVPYENNPRVISPESINACAESMRQCSALDPIEVDENNVIRDPVPRRPQRGTGDGLPLPVQADLFPAQVSAPQRFPPGQHHRRGRAGAEL